MIIGIDVDGVILDYMTTVRAYAELYDFEELHKNGVDRICLLSSGVDLQFIYFLLMKSML